MQCIRIVHMINRQIGLFCTYRQLILALAQPHAVDVAVLAGGMLLREREATDLEGRQKRQVGVGNSRFARLLHAGIASVAGGGS